MVCTCGAVVVVVESALSWWWKSASSRQKSASSSRWDDGSLRRITRGHRRVTGGLTIVGVDSVATRGGSALGVVISTACWMNGSLLLKVESCLRRP